MIDKHMKNYDQKEKNKKQLWTGFYVDAPGKIFPTPKTRFPKPPRPSWEVWPGVLSSKRSLRSLQFASKSIPILEEQRQPPCDLEYVRGGWRGLLVPCSQRGWDCKGAGAASAAACSWNGSGEGCCGLLCDSVCSCCL